MTMGRAPIVMAAWMLCGPVMGQQASGGVPQAPPAACCANARELALEALYGRWEVRFEGLADVARVDLEKHPDYPGVRGTITRHAGGSAQLAGDIDDTGALAMDESQDGLAISATWSGEPQATSYGHTFEGVWRNALDGSTRRFVLRRVVERQ